jgi:uncharacterized protein (DUF1499 family)
MTDPSENIVTRKPIGKMIGWIALAITLVFVAAIALRIDDWSRDWTQNTASLQENAERPGLRPVHLDLSPTLAEEKIRSWVETRPNWQHVATTSKPDDSIEMKLVRQTTIMRFTDDIEVLIRKEQSAGGSNQNADSNETDSNEHAAGRTQDASAQAKERVVITATSQSRVGKGDLGQNPRNLIELTTALRQSVGTVRFEEVSPRSDWQDGRPFE